MPWELFVVVSELQEELREAQALPSALQELRRSEDFFYVPQFVLIVKAGAPDAERIPLKPAKRRLVVAVKSEDESKRRWWLGASAWLRALS